jgi:zinc-finger binding domain of transposase IS66
MVIEQMVLHLEELEASLAQAQPLTQPAASDAIQPPKLRPVRRKQFPEHFERNENRIEPRECACPECGGPLGSIGKPGTAEVLKVKTITFTVTRHIRPKKRCSKCSIIVQAPAPSRPIEKSFAGASLLALVLTGLLTQSFRTLIEVLSTIVRAPDSVVVPRSTCRRRPIPPNNSRLGFRASVAFRQGWQRNSAQERFAVGGGRMQTHAGGER